MKKKFFNLLFPVILFGGIACSIPSHAQLLNRIKDKVKQTAEDHVTDDAGNATDDAVDKAEDAANKPLKNKGNHDQNKKNGPQNNSDKPVTSSAETTDPSIKAYQNYDFIPGDTILFADDFTEDQDGEFPSHWDLKSGQAVINQVTGKPTFCLTEGNYVEVLPRMKTASYLTDPFTIEFDTYTDGEGNESPILFLTYTDKNGNSSDGQIQFNRGDDEGRGDVTTSDFVHDGLTGNFPPQLIKNYVNHWHHCAVIYKNGQLKCYVDQYRVLVQPNIGCVPTMFHFGGVGGGDGHPIMITNVRAAKGGAMNMIGKKFTEAKIVTHGITFDIDKSDIKPESMGTLNMIVSILKSNPNLKFEIDGHTDNTGQAAHNLTLSQKRADAVKAQLARMGINDSRLTTKGFGDSKPISDNNTSEGKANNRRVEFVRI